MGLFQQAFLEDLKAQTDIVSVIGDVVPLKKAGATWKGLCPFHQEKTPSFNVNRDKGFFKCFGCGVGGDVVKFVELHQKIAFPRSRAVPGAARRHDMPEADGRSGRSGGGGRTRGARASCTRTRAAFYREQLAPPAGARARRELEVRGLTPDNYRRFRVWLCAGRRARHTAGSVCRPRRSRRPAAQERPGGRARRRPAGGPVPEPPDDSDRPRHGRRSWLSAAGRSTRARCRST